MMKKNLLATSALVAAGAFASQGALAEAKPIEIKVGGYYEQWVGLIFQDSDNDVSGSPERFGDALDVQEDGEIYFEGSTTLDNGLTFGMNVQMEAATSTDQIDESYLFVRGSFGEILLGSENGPAYAMHYGTDIDKGYGLEEGDTSFYWFGGGTSTQLNTSRLWLIDNDSNKMRWISPRFEGVQVGLSYSPEGRQDQDFRVPNEALNNGEVYEEIFAGAINYDQTFDGFRIRMSAGGQYVGDTNEIATGGEDEVWATALGLRLGYGGFEGTLAWSHQNGVALESYTTGSDTLDPESLDTITSGIAYTDGPMAVSLTGAYGKANGGPGGRDAEQIVVLLGTGYTVGPGVSINATAVYAYADGLSGSGEEFTGYGVVGGIKLRF